MTAAGPQAALERAASLLAGRTGLRVEGSMRARVLRAVREGAEARGEPPAVYVRTLLADPAALQALVDAITVQQTGFFRDAAHFDVLVRRALPSLAGMGVVWSAGCSSGQEAWSLAIALEEAGAADWRVLATDVSTAALARAEDGRYGERELAGLSAARRAAYLRRCADGWEVGPRLRRRVHFLAHNLAEDPPPPQAGACRVVFCRNVLIYLDAEATARALTALRARMPGDGWLFLGASESLTAGAQLFAPRRIGGTYVYRPRPRRGGAPAPGGAATRPRFAPDSTRAAPGGRRPPRRPAGPTPDPLPDARALLAAGEAHAAAGRHAEAATAFRKASYLAPDDPVPLLGLGLALEPADRSGARRAFRAARAALERAGAAPDGGDLAHLLDAKLAGPE